MSNDLFDHTIELIQNEYIKSLTPWFIGYSGGKDSSALLKLVYIALLGMRNKDRIVYVVYCDTGVEIPHIRNHAVSTLHQLEKEAINDKIPVRIIHAVPEIDERYFVKVIGRGYPPPTNKFRWCTRRLRTKPLAYAISTVHDKQGIVLLGTRHGESQERDRVLDKYKTEHDYYFSQNSVRKLIFSPIINYSVNDVWSVLDYESQPDCIDSSIIRQYYEAASENIEINRKKSILSMISRFGCWTCTVIRKDKAVTNMVKNGYHELAPLLEFRNWLAEVRENKKYRCIKRRNGTLGLGPFTLAARTEILKKLLDAERLSGLQLITDVETYLSKINFR